LGGTSEVVICWQDRTRLFQRLALELLLKMLKQSNVSPMFTVFVNELGLSTHFLDAVIELNEEMKRLEVNQHAK